MKKGNGVVWHRTDGWWFWSGIHTNRFGPYKTKKKAEKVLKKYIKKLNKGK